MPEPIAFDQDLMTTNTGNNGSGQPITVGASDLLMSTYFTAEGYPNYARAIYCCGTGNIGIKRAGDSGFTSYPVTPGQYIYGRIVAVGSTSDGSSAGMTFIPEQ